MAWIRLDDDYINHPKFVVLSHQAFRLWHEGMAYCRKLMTDGLILSSALKTFRYGTKASVKELLTPVSQGIAPLWSVDTEGYHVHDYLDWNASQEEEQRERDSAKQRMRAYRGRAQSPPVTSRVTASVTPFVTPDITPSVLGEGKGKDLSSEKERERKPNCSLESEEIAARAGRLVERYGELYAEHRHGARHRARPNLDWSEACGLVKLWTDQRLDKLAVLVLVTDDPWISGTDRSFKIFAMKAGWADNKLTEWEHENGVAV